MITDKTFDREDPRLIWVLAGTNQGKGSYDAPFGKLSDALQIVKPGESIVLRAGSYTNDQTIEISGSAERPITICSEENSEVIIEGGCWFLYDVSDLIVTGLTFRNSQRGAISVIGNCKRNRFHNLQFKDCGNSQKATCAVFLGGAGARFNMFENCVFENSSTASKKVTPENASIGLMVSDGDTETSQLIKNHIFRRNTFRNFDYGIIVGTKSISGYNSGHIVEYNIIENCNEDGIVIKAGDTQVRGNLVANCKTNSISIAGGMGTVIEDNRIINGYRGILVKDSGHTIANNCIVRCIREAIRISGKSDDENNPVSNLFIQENTFVDCGISKGDSPKESDLSAGMAIEQGSTCIIEKNLVYGKGAPYKIETTKNSGIQTNCIIIDNLCCGTENIPEGFSSSDIQFDKISEDDYQNDSEYGANGPMLTPAAFNPQMDESGNVDYLRASVIEDEEGNLIIPDETDDDDSFSSLPGDLIDPENLLI